MEVGAWGVMVCMDVGAGEGREVVRSWKGRKKSVGNSLRLPAMSVFEAQTARLATEFFPSLTRLGSSEAEDVVDNLERAVKEHEFVTHELEKAGFSSGDSASEANAIFAYAFRKHAGDSSTDVDARSTKRRKTMSVPSGTPVMDWLPGILMLAFKLSLAGKLARQAPFMLLDETLDSHPIPVCEEIWGLVESLAPVMSDPLFVPQNTRSNPSSKLWLLRLSNGLLKRLSTTQNAVFCGRISLFLAYAFPLTDKSAVNLRRDCNVDNATVFDDETAFANGLKASDAYARVLHPEAGEEVALEYDAYRNFWSLQHDFFRDGRPFFHAAKKATAQAAFMEALEKVLVLFEAHPLSQGVSSKQNAVPTTVDSFYSAKYLTTVRLFRLQLIDPEVRRHVLCQALIVFESIKNEVDVQIMGTMKKLRNRILQILVDSGPDGSPFKQGVITTLKGCKWWTTWKTKNCLPFERSVPAGQANEDKLGRTAVIKAIAEAKKKATGSVQTDAIAARRAKQGMLVHPGLCKLWEERPDFDLFGSLEPADSSIDTWFTPVVDAEDPTQGVEDEYHPKHDRVMSWRILRSMAAHKTPMLEAVFDGKVTTAAAALGLIAAKPEEEEEEVEEANGDEQQVPTEESEEGQVQEDEESPKDVDAEMVSPSAEEPPKSAEEEDAEMASTDATSS